MVAASVVAVVPARGGSKGIPRKNARPFAGHPLVAWSIAAGREASVVDRTIVSTDDPEIAEISASYGAEVPFIRPPELATDETQDLPVFQHVVGWLTSREERPPTVLVQLRPTSPLRPIGLVDRAVRSLIDDPTLDSVRAVTLSPYTPYKMWRIEGGLLHPILTHGHESYNQRRQDLPETYWQTGHVDVVWERVISLKTTMSGDRIGALVIDRHYAHDLDSLSDWDRAESAVDQMADIVRPTVSS